MASAAADDVVSVDEEEETGGGGSNNNGNNNGDGNGSGGGSPSVRAERARAVADQLSRAAVVALHTACAEALSVVGLGSELFVGGRGGTGRKNGLSPKVFLNRLMCVPVGSQVALYAYFSMALKGVVGAEKRAGRWDPGVAEIRCSPECGGVGPDGQPPRPELWCEDVSTGR